MNSRERHTITQKIKHIAQSCVLYPQLSKSSYAPIIKDLYAKEGIDMCIDYFDLIHRLNAKDNLVFLDSVMAQHVLTWFDMSAYNGKALFKLFEKHDIKTKPICKVWFKTCLEKGNLEGLRWVMGAYQSDFDFQKPKNALSFLHRAKPNPASLYFCQMLKQSEVIKERYLKEPENFEEMSIYHSLAPEFRDIFQIKEEKKQIETLLDSIVPIEQAEQTEQLSTQAQSNSSSATSTPILVAVKNRSKI